jgi:hypothetical protein
MSFHGLGFVTHRELDALLGGDAAGARQRRRLVARGWLPEAPTIFADRRRVLIYPEFALCALVLARPAVQGLRRPIENAARSAGRLYGSAAYRQLHSCLVEALNRAGAEDVVALVRSAAEVDAGIVMAWRDEVAGCVESLATFGVELDVLQAQVKEAGAAYVIEVGGRSESHPLDDSPQSLERGDLVTRDRVRVASAARDFLLPIPDFSEIGLRVGGTAGELTDADELTRALFSGLAEHVRVLPSLRAVSEPVDDAGLEIDMPWDLLAGGNSMSRSAQSGR